MAEVDDQRIGSVIRAVRHRRGFRQIDVAQTAGVSQAYVSYVERGQLDRLTVDTVRRIGAALDVRLPFEPRWRGAELDRLLDAEHSAVVEQVTAILVNAQWEAVLEFGFNHFGERGSIDILGWQPTERALLIVEVKTRLANVQQLFSALARKVRIVPELVAKERGWDARSMGRVLVISGTTANRTVVERLRSSFDVTFPSRAREVRRWLERPHGAMAGIWFIAPITSADGTHDRPARSRVRRPVGTAAADATSPIERR